MSHIDETALATKQSPPAAATTIRKPRQKEEDKEEQRLVDHSVALSTIIHRKKIPALTAYLTEYKLSPDFALHPISTHSHTSTLLHLASSSCLTTVVSHLLSIGANPEVQNAAGKTPYEVAGDRSTRDRFRLARRNFGENRWNWEAAKVGKPLTEQEVAQRDRREANDIAESKAQQLAEQKRLADEAVRPSQSKISGNGKSGVGATKEPPRGPAANDRGMTEEMRIKIERERRARAAEARITAFAKK